MAERNAAIPTAERIEFRVGVNVGDVIVEKHDIFGDGVNVAARLEAMLTERIFVGAPWPGTRATVAPYRKGEVMERPLEFLNDEVW
jgi:hypothetical protein